MIKRSMKPLAMAAAVALLAACGSSSPNRPTAGGASATTPKSGGSLAIGVEAAWSPIDPLSVGSFTDHDVAFAVFAPLFQVQPNGTLAPDLALSYSVSSNGKTYTIQLRHGVTFQDGTPFNAAAAVFNLQRVSDKANHCKCYASIKDVSSVTAAGNYTVIVTLSAPDASFPTSLSDVAGMMASPTAVRAEGQSFGQHPVGAGPFKFQSEVPGNSVTFVKWNGYWDKPRPYLDSVTFKTISDADSRFASLQSGTIQDDEDIIPTQIATGQSSSNLKVESLGGVGTYFIEMQNAVAPFNSLLARQALTYATDPGPINNALFDNKYTLGIESPWTPQSWAYPGANVPGYPAYNLAKAKALVSQLGGLSFTLTIRNDPTTIAMAQALQSQWAQAGIRTTINELENLTLVADSAAGKYQAMIYRWQGSYDPDGNVSVFFSTGSPQNSDKLSDPEVDSLIAQERAATTESARKPILLELAKQLAADDPQIYLWAADWWRASVKDLHGVPKLANNNIILSGAWLG